MISANLRTGIPSRVLDSMGLRSLGNEPGTERPIPHDLSGRAVHIETGNKIEVTREQGGRG